MGRLVSGLNDGHRLSQEMAVILWEDVVGRAIFAHTSPVRVISGIMTVNVDSSVWAQELSFQREEIRRRLNERMGREYIRDIRFRVGKVASRSPVPENEVVAPGEEERLEAERISAAIADAEVAAAFKRFLEHELCRQRVRRSRGWVKCINCGALHPQTEEVCRLCRGLRPADKA